MIMPLLHCCKQENEKQLFLSLSFMKNINFFIFNKIPRLTGSIMGVYIYFMKWDSYTLTFHHHSSDMHNVQKKRYIVYCIRINIKEKVSQITPMGFSEVLNPNSSKFHVFSLFLKAWEMLRIAKMLCSLQC